METCGHCLHRRASVLGHKSGPASTNPARSLSRTRRTTLAAYQNNNKRDRYNPYSNASRSANTSSGPQYGSSSSADPVNAPQLRQWLKSPFDVLALGPRATLGALLNASELAQSLPAEIEKFQMLAQDPRPLQDKQAVFAQEIQTTVATLVEKGAVAESEIVAVLQEILPPQLQQLIPEEMKAVAVQRPEVVQQQAQEAEYEEPPLSAEQLKNSQTGEELAQLKTAVTGVKEALADLKANTDPAKAAVIRLNVQDARDSLRRRLNQLSPDTTSLQGAPVSEAKSEATSLLTDVDAALSNSNRRSQNGRAKSVVTRNWQS